MGFSWFSCHSSGGEATQVDGEITEIGKVKIYKYREIRQATDGFSTENKIGEGGFGSVYKGCLRDGKLAAIKVLSAESRQAGGYTRSGIQFDWSTRANICVGVAKGLAFLHEEVRPHIIHRDIKASNILLDKYLSPKISDFGLAKLIPANMSHVSTRVAGTIGYLAPEYAVRGQLTRKADIYSFGVLIMEIVSGRCNTNTRLPTKYQYLLERAWELYERNELVDLVDSGLNGVFDAEEACRYLKIGLLCTQDSPKLRPCMSKVVRLLTGEKDIDYKKISKPGLISDFMDMKARGGPVETKPEEVNRHNSTNPSSSSYTSSRDHSHAYSSGASSANV